jgi:hypothetical protein
MKGPYTFTVSLAATVQTGADSVKRFCIRKMCRTVKWLGVVDEDRAHGEVRDGDGNLVKQVEAYRTSGGAVKVRDVEL